MRRRAFIAGLGSTAAWPLVARGEQPAMPVVGFIGIGSPESYGTDELARFATDWAKPDTSMGTT